MTTDRTLKTERQLITFILFATVAASKAVQAQSVAQSTATAGKKPSVVYFLVDNLGMGELSSYRGGLYRGVTTTHIDDFAGQGIMLLNFAPEAHKEKQL
jgi:arylsulfatase